MYVDYMVALTISQVALAANLTDCYYFDQGPVAVNNTICPGSSACCGPTANQTKTNRQILASILDSFTLDSVMSSAPTAYSNVLYPQNDDATLDMDYYSTIHPPICAKIWGPHG
ncbi:hypothetical protein M409DRAFT_61438 [Zasmidium cellare ATCC 36951]|uniref:Uncharacterized protein n=1 Tax=Zasmidium cellare ATCC 36951 TaxID=1080233 RepID=A0A6A6BYR4_ZASCE|nr:uncharacterized protein M409DRAFT_61438 [Zasmidium cellare ATCC 36951]KAF2158722.1 hypothetical protein M409DRAFT_61438 [Zasmidium cellare ATCC 36951]